MNEQGETVLRQSPQLVGITDEDKSNLYRTKDIYLTAFLVSRGFHWFGMEEIESALNGKNRFQKHTQKKKKLIYFYFQDREIVRNIGLNYHNGTSVNLNVNASIFVQNILTLRSIITDPPF
jgi:hypothetical protein